MSDTPFGTTKDDEQSFYICGQCGDKQYYLRSEEPEIPCPDCGWNHGSRKKNNVPPIIKLDITQY